MDYAALTKSMIDLMDKLKLVEAIYCSDIFLTTLNKLIDTAHELSTTITLPREDETIVKEQRLTYVSSASDEVQRVSVEIPILQVDSDSEDEQRSEKTDINGDDVQSVGSTDSISSSDVSVVAVNGKEETMYGLNELDVRALCKKRCSVKIQRMEVAGSQFSTHETNRNPANSGGIRSAPVPSVKVRRMEVTGSLSSTHETNPANSGGIGSALAPPQDGNEKSGQLRRRNTKYYFKIPKTKYKKNKK